jgi:alpha-galactosidase
MKHLTWFVLFITAGAFALQGVDGEAQRVFRLDGGDVTYVVGVNETGQLQTIYWGTGCIAVSISK